MSADAVPFQKKSHGCFFYGCLTVIILAVVVGLLGWLAVSKGKSWIRGYTSDKPADIPVVQLPESQLSALKTRIESFEVAMRDDKPGQLVLSATEINALLNLSPEFAQMGGRMSVAIEGDQIKAQVSLPMDVFKDSGLPLDFLRIRGRYFNGGAKLRIGLQSGRLLIFCDELEANGKPLPEMVMKEFRAKNLAEKSMDDPQTAAAIAKLKSVTVQNGSIIVER